MQSMITENKGVRQKSALKVLTPVFRVCWALSHPSGSMGKKPLQFCTLPGK